MEEVVNCEPRLEVNYSGQNYDVSISTLDLGYHVRVGCKSFAFETKEKMIEKLLEYFDNPDAKQKQFFDTKTI